METMGRSDSAQRGSPLQWHFRVLPPEVQRGAVRRLALSGVGAKEIAARTGLPVDAVQRTVLEDECVARLMPSYRGFI